MLNVCRSKGISADLRQLDIRTTPWPYPEGYFDHVIACGMLLFLDDLAPVFQEAARVVRARGLFAFTTKAPLPEHGPEAHSSKYLTDVIGGVTIFSHRKAYLEELMLTFRPFLLIRYQLAPMAEHTQIQGLASVAECVVGVERVQ